MNRGMWRKKMRMFSISGWFLFGMIVVFLLTGGLGWASSGHEEAAKGFEITDFYRIVCFVILAVALFIIIRKWVAPLFGARIRGIKNELQDLEARKKEAEEKLAQYNERLSDLEKEAEKIVESYIEQGKEAQTRILAQAKESAEKLEAHARRQIENAFQRARAEIQEAILEKALAKAEAAIRKNISAEDQTQLVDDYLQKVVAS